MPRLVLFEDDGREIFAGDVSDENVALVGRFLRRNAGAFRAAAAFKQALEAAGDLLGLRPARSKPRALARRQGETRVTYEPPRANKRRVR